MVNVFLNVPTIRSHLLADASVWKLEAVAAVAVGDERHHRVEEPKGTLELGLGQVFLPRGLDASQS